MVMGRRIRRVALVGVGVALVGALVTHLNKREK